MSYKSYFNQKSGGNLDDIKNLLLQLNDRSTKLKNTKQKLQARVEECDKKTTELNYSIDDLKNLLKQSREKNYNLEAEVKKTKDINYSLENEINQTLNKNDKLINRNKEMKNRIISIKEILEGLV